MSTIMSTERAEAEAEREELKYMKDLMAREERIKQSAEEVEKERETAEARGGAAASLSVAMALKKHARYAQARVAAENLGLDKEIIGHADTSAFYGEATRKEDPKGDTVAAAEAELEQEKKERHAKQVDEMVKEISFYLIFMIVYWIASVRITDRAPFTFYMADSVKTLLADPGVPGEGFLDIDNYDDLVEWMENDLIDFLHPSGGYGPGTVLRHEVVLGGMRVGQIRAAPHACKDQLPPELLYGKDSLIAGYGKGSKISEEPQEEWRCFKSMAGSLVPWYARDRWSDTIKDELRDPEWNGFYYDGDPEIIIPSVRKQRGEEGVRNRKQKARAQYSVFPTVLGIKYMAPAYAVLLDTRHARNETEAKVARLIDNGYIDQNTAAIFFDIHFYNPLLNRLLSMRLTAQMLPSGAIRGEQKQWSHEVWQTESSKTTRIVLESFVGAFYVYYFLCEVYELFQKGGRYFCEFLNWMQCVNLGFYFWQYVIKLASEDLAPTEIYITSHAYNDFIPWMMARSFNMEIRAFNAFLNWFKIVAYLSLLPAFGLIGETLNQSLETLVGFMAVFFIVAFGFSNAHLLVFGDHIEDFSTTDRSAITLFRSLLGDFDFPAMHTASTFVGPLFFIMYVGLAVLVILNMIIAIITEGYLEADKKEQDKVWINLPKRIILQLFYWAEAVPIAGKPVKAVRECGTSLATKAFNKLGECLNKAKEDAQAQRAVEREVRGGSALKVGGSPPVAAPGMDLLMQAVKKQKQQTSTPPTTAAGAQKETRMAQMLADGGSVTPAAPGGGIGAGSSLAKSLLKNPRVSPAPATPPAPAPATDAFAPVIAQHMQMQMQQAQQMATMQAQQQQIIMHLMSRTLPAGGDRERSSSAGRSRGGDAVEVMGLEEWRKLQNAVKGTRSRQRPATSGSTNRRPALASSSGPPPVHREETHRTTDTQGG